MNIRFKKLSQPLQLGLSLVAGGGFILMVVALAIGALQGDAANMGLVSGAFVLGLTLFLFGLIAWLAVTRPWEHFDDINQPTYTGHHGHEPHADHTLVVSETHGVEPHAESHP